MLELAELVTIGALQRLPAGVVDLPSGAGDLDPELDLDLEDAEGTAVARVRSDGSVTALRPFSHGPLRSRRRTPEQIRALGATPPGRAGIAVPVAGPLTGDQVAAIVRSASGGGARPLVWLALIGAGRSRSAAAGPSPEGLWRALTAVADEAGHDGGGAGIVVPLALPVGHDDLLPAIAEAFGAPNVMPVPPAAAGGQPHPAFARELARVRPPQERGVVLFFTGLSGSGKSTLAKAVAERLLEDGRRRVTMLDGDEVRRLLSHGLGFSREDRDLNIRRIGYVAAEVARHGGLAICAPIAPYAGVRAQVRDQVEEAGGLFLLVHVATPLAECERRDRKGLYARARRGEIADFTGISAPYEPPTDADLVLDTTGRPVDGGVEAVWGLLRERGLLPTQ